MRAFKIFLFCLLAVPASWGQTFVALPGPVLTQEVAFEQAAECYIFFDNPSGDTLQLRWRSLEASFPDAWDIDVCDYGACYIGIPPNAAMNPIYGNIQAYLKLIVQPGLTSGAAWLWFRVHELNNDANFADVYFNLHTPGVTNATEAQASPLRAFPNPARDILTVENRDAEARPFRLTDAAGVCRWQTEIPAYGQTSMQTSDWPSGIYFLQTTNTVYKIVLAR